MNIQEIRKKYPQYSDLSDEQLAKGLHQKFYSDLPFDTFAQRIGFGVKTVEPTEQVVSPEEMLTPMTESAEKQALREKTKEYEASSNILERAGRDIKRGALRAMNILPSLSAASRQKEIERIRRGEVGRTDPMTGEFIPLSPEEEEAAIANLQQAQVEDLESVAKREAKARAIPGRPVTAAVGKAETFGEALEAFSTDPFGAMAGFSLESLPQMAPALAVGAATRQPLAAAAAMGGSSMASELGNSVFEYLSEQGVDVNDTNAVMSALDDPKMFKDAYDFAMKRAAIIGTVDAATAGLASKALVPKKLIGSPKAREVVNIAIAQPVSQMASGAGGEAAAQLATYGEIRKPGEVIAEMIGEGPTSIAETAAFGGRRIYEEFRAKEAAAEAEESKAPAERVEPTVKPTVEPEVRAEEKVEEQVIPAFDEEAVDIPAQVSAVTPTVDNAEVTRLEADLAKVQRRQMDPTLSLDDPKLVEYQQQEADIRAKIDAARGVTPVTEKPTFKPAESLSVPYKEYRPGDTFNLDGREWRVTKVAHTGKNITAGTTDKGGFQSKVFEVETPTAPVTPVTESLYDRLIKASPTELKKIEIPTSEAPDLYLRASEDENASPALIKKLTKIVNEMGPEEFAEPKAEIETPEEETVKAGPMAPPPPVETIMENFGVGKVPAQKYLDSYTKFYDLYNRFQAGEDIAQEYTDALVERNKSYQRIVNISRQNQKRAEAKRPEAKKPTRTEITKPQGLTVKFGNQSFPVSSIDDAQEKWIEFRDQTGAGVSQIGNGVNIIDQDGNFVARISYNGRVWDSPYDDAKVIKEAPDVQAAPPVVTPKQPPKDVKAPITEELSPAEKVKVAEELLDGLRLGEQIDSTNQQGVQELLGISRGFDAPVARRLMAIAKVPKAIQDKVMAKRPVTIDDLSEFIAPLVAEKAARAKDEKLFSQAAEAAETNDEIRNALNAYQSYKNMMDAIATERGKYGVKWAERNVSARWVEQSQKAKKAKQRVIDLMRKQPAKKPAAVIVDEQAAVNRVRQAAQKEMADAAARELEIGNIGGELDGPIKTINKFKVYKVKVSPSEVAWRVQSPFNRAMNRIGEGDSYHSNTGTANDKAQGSEPLTVEQFAYYMQRAKKERAAAPAAEVKVKEVPVTEAKKEEHVEAGEAEPITKPVIQEAVQKGATKQDIDYAAMKRDIERQVDEAIAKSPYKTNQEWDATYTSRKNFVTFNIPGDGTFKVKNNKERLEDFKKRLTSAVKPKSARGPQFALAPADVNTTLRDLVDANDIQSAIEFAALKGITIAESKLDLRQKLKVQEYIKDPDAFEKKVEEEAALTETQRQAMAKAAEDRRLAEIKRRAEEDEKRERDWINARYDDLMIGSERTVKNILRTLTKSDADKLLDKIDTSEDKPSQDIIDELQKKAGTYIETRWKDFANSIDSPAEAAKVRKKLFEKYTTKEGSVYLHQLVEKEVDGGSRIITMESGERRLGDADGYLSEKKIGTVGMDYAGFLISQEKRKKPDVEEKLTDEQIENAKTHAEEVGGEVVFQKGDYALIRGYSMMSGDPVYVPVAKTQRGKVDIERFTGTQIPTDVKQEMIMFKRQAERDAEEKHKSDPFIKFDRGLAISEDIAKDLAGVIRGWKDLLKLDVPIYVSTIDDAKKNRNKFTGPHRRVGSGTLDTNERGSMRRMADDSYYILFDKSISPTFMLEVIAHEMGHLHQRLVYEKATPEQKSALQKAHQNWLSRQEGKMAKDLVEALRGRATGRRVKPLPDQTVLQMSSYWKSFGEWYADQVSRWSVTGKAPVTIVEKFFKRLANQLRNFYQKLANAKYLPDETFVDYIEEVTQRPANLAPGDTVIDDTPELMKDVDTDETRQVDELLAKHNRSDAPMHPSDSVKDRMVNAYRSSKDIRKRIEDEGLANLGKGVITGVDRAITYARNKNVWYGSGLDQADFSRYNGQLRDSQGKAVASIAVTNAIHAGHVGTQVMVQGKLVYNPKSQQFMAKKSDKSMANVLKEKAKLVDKLGAQRAANVIQAYFEAKRSRSIVNEFLEREQRYQDAIEAGIDPEEAANDLANIERAMSKVNMDDEQIDDFIGLEKDYPELRVMMDNWTAVNQNQLDMSYFAGNLSKKRYEQLKSIKDYVPWYRIMEDQKDPHDFPTGGTTRTMTNVAKEKRFKAGEVDLDIDDIVDNMIHNVMWMTKNTMRNYAANRVADEYGIRNEKGKLKVFPKEGTDSQGVKFNILRNGRRIVVGVEDPLIAESVLGMENVEIPMNKILSIMANGLRRSITLSGAFQLKQLFMDAPTAAWVSGVKNPFAVWGNTFIAFGKVLVDKDPIAQQLRQAGIGGFMSTARTPEKELALEIGLLNNSMYAKVLRVLDHIGDASDYAQRVSIYKQVLKETKEKDYQRLLKQGKTKEEAREMARGDEVQALLQANNVIDFLKRGSGQTAQFLGRTVAFMNAYAQSVDVLATTLAGGGLKGMERKKAITRMAITGTLLSFVTLMYCFAVGDDEEYEKLDDKTKLRNFVIPGSKKYFGETVTLPMHTSASFFFKAIPELLYNTYVREGAKDEMDSRRFRRGLKEAFIDAMLGPNVVPTGVKPFVEVGLNKNFWSGTEIIPKGMEDLIAAEQYTAATSELGKVVSALTSIPGTDDKRILAPVEADHLMRGLFGSAAAMAMWGTNMLAGDRAESRVKDLPVIGAFVLPPIPRGREDLFYDLKDVTDQKYKTYKSLLDREKYEEADKYLEKNEGLIALYDYTSQMDTALKEINKEIRRIGTTSAKDMSPKDRREQMNEYGTLKGEILEGIESLRKQAFD